MSDLFKNTFQPWRLYSVPDHFKTQEMGERAIEDEPETLEYVPNHFKTQTMCERAVENEPYSLKFVPDHFKAQEICDKAVEEDLYSLQYVPDWFVTREGYICGMKAMNIVMRKIIFLSGMIVIRNVGPRKLQ